MEKITVPRMKLIKTLKVNLENHVAEYNRALVGYQRVALEEVDKERAKLADTPAHRISLTEFPPQNHAADYEQALRMLEMSVDENLSISGEDFRHFIDDNWSWRGHFTESTAKYLGRR